MDIQVNYEELLKRITNPRKYCKFPPRVVVAVRHCAEQQRKTTSMATAATTSTLLMIVFAIVGYWALATLSLAGVLIFAVLYIIDQTRFDRVREDLDFIYADYVEICDKLQIFHMDFAELPDLVQDHRIKQYLKECADQIREARKEFALTDPDRVQTLERVEHEFKDTYAKCYDVGLILERNVDRYMSQG